MLGRRLEGVGVILELVLREVLVDVRGVGLGVRIVGDGTLVRLLVEGLVLAAGGEIELVRGPALGT